MWTSVKSLCIEWKLCVCLVVLFWISFPPLVESLPGRISALRSIHFRPYRYTTDNWESVAKGPDYEYEEEEYVNVEPDPRPTADPYPEPEPISFGGTFHVSQDRFVSFGASDVMVGSPPYRNTFSPHDYRRPTPIHNVPSASNPEFEPTTTGSLRGVDGAFRPPHAFYRQPPHPREYFTPPTVYYRPTEPPLPLPSSSANVPPESSVDDDSDVHEVPVREKKQNSNLQTINRTENNLLSERHIVANDNNENDMPVPENEEDNMHVPENEEDNVPHSESVPNGDHHWKKPSILSTLNKLTATTTAAPHHDLIVNSFDNSTSQNSFIDLEQDTTTSAPYLDLRDIQAPPELHLASDAEVPIGSRHESSISSVVKPSSNTSGVDVTDSSQNNTGSPSESQPTGRRLSSGAIAGIVIGILTPLSLAAGAVVYLMYGRHFKNLGGKGESRGTTDNCAYIDDSVRPSGYMNSHIELPKENSEEMTSLDNDSFLNSLEAVTIQNYWAESAKNTKV